MKLDTRMHQGMNDLKKKNLKLDPSQQLHGSMITEKSDSASGA
jgi:hypothetical protein